MQPLERTSQGIFTALTAGVSFKTPETGAATASDNVVLPVALEVCSVPAGSQ